MEMAVILKEIETIIELAKQDLLYEIESLEWELQKAHDTIELMNDERKELDKEILSLQEQVKHLEKRKGDKNGKSDI